jgi:hypothetical protein
MAAICPSCGSPVPENETACKACGWDSEAKAHVGKPAGLDLFFAPRADAPKPRPQPAEPEAPFVDAALGVPPPAPAAPADPFAAISRRPPSAPAAYPSNLLNPMLEALGRTQPGRELLALPRARAAVAELRKPSVFSATAGVLACLGAIFLYMIWPSPPPPPPPPAAPAAAQAYVRPTATFTGAPVAIVAGSTSAAAPAPGR